MIGWHRDLFEDIIMTTAVLDRAHDKTTQRLSAKGLALLYGVPQATIAHAIAVNVDAIRKHPASRPIQESLSVLFDCFARLYETMNSDEEAVRRWLHRPNRELDGAQPVTLLEKGRLSDFKAIVRLMSTGAYA